MCACVCVEGGGLLVDGSQAGKVKLWTIICCAKYNACQMNWISNLQKNPTTLAAARAKATEEKVVRITVRACARTHVLEHVAVFIPPLPPALSNNCLKKVTNEFAISRVINRNDQQLLFQTGFFFNFSFFSPPYCNGLGYRKRGL